MPRSYRVSGVMRQRIVRKGKMYEYLRHRATGKRIKSQEGTAAFLLEVERLDEEAKGITRDRSQPGTWGWLVAKYFRSHEFASLAERTKSDYLRVAKTLEGMDGVGLSKITPKSLFDLRDLIHEKRGQKMANYALALVSLVWSWGRPRGLTPLLENPAQAVPKVRRDKSRPRANRSWSDLEISSVLDASSGGVRIAVALGAYTGQRQGDVLSLTWDQIREGHIYLTQRKTGATLHVPLHPNLVAILAEAGPFEGPVVKNNRGARFTSDGFRASFFKVIRKLQDIEAVRPGLTFHGLRHTVATRLADAGATSEEIQSITGHERRDTVEHYTKTADQKRRANAAMRLFVGESDPVGLLKNERQSVKK